ncbi:hypothetical protein SUGI_0690510 [Cryptomeria japonica]|uniref:uncharacterized protein LOC131052429 n=1 Tax=Cryptomeria japonica TaxID=3369 RepID=UPI002414CE59|nr:uncharacterized protein LOC131052429 [Cryptomeria japonica]XP_057843081.2 uncharacterized protein LOC131052429 [Cryptomeria japonica]XP_057843082.2 uncharacterized protein LOC131052429 [Cryptomeria japonica]XP_057843083.2 uncharacterized protein LOC131052429 [Cryptomeria japonica]XP_057843084.2 uncharacterized protein LOC131052429 [Cryptomeria japonica]GLJ34340.1 hypothetical protein SUGI_0690510 [Cryptomeria japonica]
MNVFCPQLLETKLMHIVNDTRMNRITYMYLSKLSNLAGLSQNFSSGNVGSPIPQCPPTLTAINNHTDIHCGKSIEIKGAKQIVIQHGKPIRKTNKKPSTGKEKGDINFHQSKLSEKQKAVLMAVSEGKSVFFSGAAGTGKTSLLRKCVAILKKNHGVKSVFVTASTGIAASALKGTTLHSFAGIGMGLDSEENLLLKVGRGQALNRWRKAKALVIDEISMIDGDLFDKLNCIAKRFSSQKQTGEEFGGRQLVVTGDFGQLPPVNPPNLEKQFAFQADCWHKCFDMQTELDIIFRQSDLPFMKMLNEFRRGICSPESIDMLRPCLGRPELDDGMLFTKLYPHRLDVTRENEQKLRELEKEMFTFYAEDSGHEYAISRLDSTPVVKELSLCIGAQVMLTYNINIKNGLVNGRKGVVQGFELDTDQTNEKAITHKGVWPVVKFQNLKQPKIIKPECYEVHDFDKNGKVIVAAKRKQVPLILAWALSLHKSQGMTLDRIETDLSNAFGCGMVYLALSRLKKLDGLRLLGFDPSKVKAHPDVLDFYEKLSKH